MPTRSDSDNTVALNVRAKNSNDQVVPVADQLTLVHQRANQSAQPTHRAPDRTSQISRRHLYSLISSREMAGSALQLDGRRRWENRGERSRRGRDREGTSDARGVMAKEGGGIKRGVKQPPAD